ncbi:hypothetical protein B0H10DRAFT_1741552, partial [Mycena sp. CBHHK59/15]
PRLTLDPSLESCDDHTSAIFKPVRDLLVAGSAGSATPLTDADAAAQLTAVWTTGHDARQAAWDAQVQADADHATALADQAEADRLAAEAVAEAERLEAEKKKPKLGAFDAALAMPAPRASNFAKKKLDDREYIELWYWTKEGCLDAESLRGGVEADESFGITQIGSTLSLKPLTAFKASKKVVRDEDLTWMQLSLAKTGFLAAIEAAGWPKEYRAALSSFFYAIEFHSSRMNHDDHADTILVIYQARARRHWHDALAQGNGFNIAIFNDKFLEQISTEFHNKYRSSQYRMVRNL